MELFVDLRPAVHLNILVFITETRFSTTAAIVATGAIIWKPGFMETTKNFSTDGSDKNASQSTFHTVKTSSSATCLLYTSPSPRDLSTYRMPSSA